MYLQWRQTFSRSPDNQRGLGMFVCRSCRQQSFHPVCKSTFKAAVVSRCSGRAEVLCCTSPACVVVHVCGSVAAFGWVICNAPPCIQRCVFPPPPPPSPVRVTPYHSRRTTAADTGGDDDIAIASLLTAGAGSGAPAVPVLGSGPPTTGNELLVTGRIDAAAASRPRRLRADRKPSGGVRRVGGGGPGPGGVTSSTAPSAATATTTLAFESDSAAAMLHRPFATVKLDDLTAYKASLTGGAAAAAAQLSQLQGSNKGGKVSKGREVRLCRVTLPSSCCCLAKTRVSIICWTISVVVAVDEPPCCCHARTIVSMMDGRY